jgi:hypothetical protein
MYPGGAEQEEGAGGSRSRNDKVTVSGWALSQTVSKRQMIEGPQN